MHPSNHSLIHSKIVIFGEAFEFNLENSDYTDKYGLKYKVTFTQGTSWIVWKKMKTVNQLE